MASSISTMHPPAGAATAERRQTDRRILTRPCKIFRPLTHRYAAACTRDTSPDGALIEIDAVRPLSVGERLGVGIAWGAPQDVLAGDELVPCTVTRVTDLGPDRQAVAVKFDHATGEGHGEN